MKTKDTNADLEQVEKGDVYWLNDVKKSRDIVSEILKFGVNQQQKKNIISLLALELEDRDLMISIRNCIEPVENSDSSNSGTSKTNLLYPGGIEDE
tara:strand:- start:1475 stop:1762 length:288 start_codon:yes stop_codon:yes gene_type:complete